MSDELVVAPEAPAEERLPLNRRWQRGVGISALGFCAAVFLGLIMAAFAGYPVGDIHKSALWWVGFLGATIVISWALRLDERLPVGWWSPR